MRADTTYSTDTTAPTARVCSTRTVTDVKLGYIGSRHSVCTLVHFALSSSGALAAWLICVYEPGPVVAACPTLCHVTLRHARCARLGASLFFSGSVSFPFFLSLFSFFSLRFPFFGGSDFFLFWPSFFFFLFLLFSFFWLTVHFFLLRGPKK